MRRRHMLGWLGLALLACRSAAEPAAMPTSTETPRPAALFLTPPPAPGPIVFPRDYGSHDVLTEWWYYTGHLSSETQERFGFEFVVFQVQRFGYPVVYAAHAAVTAIDRQRFQWDERAVALPQRQESWPLRLTVLDWHLVSDGESDRIQASSDSFALFLELRSLRPPVLHHGGYFEWAPATGSYYYSRTRLASRGRLHMEDGEQTVSGLGWHDHQWGNFILGPGGWDWFALQLDDGTDLMLWQSRTADQTVVDRRGTVVLPDGRTLALEAEQIRIRSTGTWTSPHTGAVYPSGWEIALLPLGLVASVTPLAADQELQTLRSTGTIYWEGAVTVQAQHNGRPVDGQGYVELTGYAPAASTVAAPTPGGR